MPNCLTEMFEVFKSTAKIDGESDDEEHFKYLLLQSFFEWLTQFKIKLHIPFRDLIFLEISFKTRTSVLYKMIGETFFDKLSKYLHHKCIILDIN